MPHPNGQLAEGHINELTGVVSYVVGTWESCYSLPSDWFRGSPRVAGNRLLRPTIADGQLNAKVRAIKACDGT